MSEKIRGLDILIEVEVDGTPVQVAGQRGATLSRSADTIDATTKDASGWVESLQGLKSWQIELDGALIDGDESYQYLEKAFMESEQVNVFMKMPSGKKYGGKAIIEDFPLEAPYDDLATYSLTLTGSGALEDTTKVGE